MADNKDKKVLNVPALRFPEFTEEWETVKIGTITKKVGSGVTPRGGESVYRSKGHPFVRSQNIGWGRLLLNDIAYIDEETHKKQLNTALELNDVLLNITGASIGRCAVVNEMIVNGNVNQHVCIIRSNGAVDSEFLCNYLLSNYGQKQIDSFQAGGNRQGLNFEQIKSIRISIPTLDEQKHIAKLLCAINQRIETQNKIIEDLKKLKSALYQEVFGSLVAPTLKLGQVAEIVKGKQVNGTELLEQGDYYVMNGGTSPSGWLNKFNTEANTISISEGGNSCGYVQYNTSPYWSGGHCYSLKILYPQEISDLYLYHFLKWQEENIMSLRIGSGLPNIQKKDLLRFPVILPAISQQNKIVSVLSAIEEKVSCEISITKYLIKQKEYLLSQLFI